MVQWRDILIFQYFLLEYFDIQESRKSEYSDIPIFRNIGISKYWNIPIIRNSWILEYIHNAIFLYSRNPDYRNIQMVKWHLILTFWRGILKFRSFNIYPGILEYRNISGSPKNQTIGIIDIPIFHYSEISE